MIGTALNTAAKALLWILLLGAAGYVAYDRLVPCKAPVAYSVGAYDIRFGISKEELLSAAKEAAAVWNTAAGKELFVYRSEGGMPINLVYDNRQATTQKTNQIKATIDQGTDTADAVREQYSTAKAQYDQARPPPPAGRAGGPRPPGPRPRGGGRKQPPPRRGQTPRAPPPRGGGGGERLYAGRLPHAGGPAPAGQRARRPGQLAWRALQRAGAGHQRPRRHSQPKRAGRV